MVVVKPTPGWRWRKYSPPAAGVVGDDGRPYSHPYGIMGEMKTTVDLPDELLIEAKKQAAEERITLREIITHALRRELEERKRPQRRKRRKIRFVTAPGSLPEDLDLSSREKMWEWIEKQAK